MYRPAVPATATASPLLRRLVLGTALLVGLAVAFVPRTALVHAEESKPAPSEPVTSASPASKPISKSDETGSIPRSEPKDPAGAAKGSATPGDSSDAEDASTSVSGKTRSGRHSVIIGKDGRIQVDGIGGNHDLGTVGDFARDEAGIAKGVAMIVAVVFLSPVLAIALILWYRMRRARMLNQTMITLAEKGVLSGGEAIAALAAGAKPETISLTVGSNGIREQATQIHHRAAWSDLRKGVFTGGVGAALSLYSLLEDREPNAIGLILLFVGLGFVALWWFEERRVVAIASADAIAGKATSAPPPPG